MCYMHADNIHDFNPYTNYTSVNVQVTCKFVFLFQDLFADLLLIENNVTNIDRRKQ